MPTYEFRCSNGHRFDQFHKISDAPSTAECPECGAIAERMISGGAGLVFKGSGFYLTDYGKNAHRTSGSAAPSASGDGDGGGSKGESKSDAKSESKSESKAESKAESKSDAKPASGSAGSGGSTPSAPSSSGGSASGGGSKASE
jgi:putative FmdB family regulatory protein